MPRAAHEADRASSEPRAVAGGADHDERSLGRQDHLGRAIERRRDAPPAVRSDGAAPSARRRISSRGDILRQFQMDGPGPLLRRDAERIAHERRDAGRADDLPRHLGQRLHRGDDVDDLEPRLSAVMIGLLAGDHDHRHGAEMRIGGAGGEVQRARTERRDADARPCRSAAHGLRP